MRRMPSKHDTPVAPLGLCWFISSLVADLRRRDKNPLGEETAPLRNRGFTFTERDYFR